MCFLYNDVNRHILLNWLDLSKAEGQVVSLCTVILSLLTCWFSRLSVYLHFFAAVHQENSRATNDMTTSNRKLSCDYMGHNYIAAGFVMHSF